MKTLVSYINEARKKEEIKPKFCSPQFDECSKLSWAGRFKDPYDKRYYVTRNDINTDKLVEWLDENYDKLDKPVQIKIDLAHNLINKDIDKLEEMLKDEMLMHRYFEYSLTSAGFTKDIDNRKCMPGMVESIALLVCTGYDDGYKVDDGRLGEYTLKSIIAFLKKSK